MNSPKIWALGVLLVFGAAWSAKAHSLYVPKDITGVSIAPLSHGQMGVISNHRGDIETLAAWVAVKDDEVRKLLAFSREQYARCFWGLVPRGIEDEASPMNECSHAYLAADQAMLVRMRTLPYWQQKAVALFDAVERDMIDNGSSVVLCAFSATPFNTASPVDPDWHDFATHPPSLLSMLGAVVTLVAGLVLAMGVIIRRIGRASMVASEQI